MKVGILTLCESASTTGISQSLNIVGASDMIFADNAPNVIPVCCLVYRIRFDLSEEGIHAIKVSIIDLDGKFVVRPIERKFDVKIQGNFSTILKHGIMNLNRVLLPTFGEYRVELFVDAVRLESQTLYFLKK